MLSAAPGLVSFSGESGRRDLQVLPKTPVQELRALDSGSWSENEDKQMNSPESADD